MQNHQSRELDFQEQLGHVTPTSSQSHSVPLATNITYEDEDEVDCGYQVGVVQQMMQDKCQLINFNPNKKSYYYSNKQSQSKLNQFQEPHLNFSFQQSNHSDYQSICENLLLGEDQTNVIQFSKQDNQRENKKIKVNYFKGTQHEIKKQIFAYNNIDQQENNNCQDEIQNRFDHVNLVDQSSSHKIQKNYFYNNSQSSSQKQSINDSEIKNDQKPIVDNQQQFQSRRSVEGRRGRSNRRKSTTKNQGKNASPNEKIEETSDNSQKNITYCMNPSAKSKQKELVNMSNRKIYDMISETQTSDIFNCTQSNKQFINKINMNQFDDNQSAQHNYLTYKQSESDIKFLNYRTDQNLLQTGFNTTNVEKLNEKPQIEIIQQLLEQNLEKDNIQSSNMSEQTTFQYTNIQENEIQSDSQAKIIQSKSSYYPNITNETVKSSDTLLNQKQDKLQVYPQYNQQEQIVLKKQIQTKSQENQLTQKLCNNQMLFINEQSRNLENKLEDNEFQKLNEIDHSSQIENLMNQEFQNFNSNLQKSKNIRNEIKTPQIIKIQSKSFSSLSKQKPYQSTKMFLQEQQEKIKRVQEESMILSPNGHSRPKGKKENIQTQRTSNAQKQEDDPKQRETGSTCMMTERARRDYLNHTIATSRKLNSQISSKVQTQKVNSRKTSSTANDLIDKNKVQKPQNKIDNSNLMVRIQSSMNLQTQRHNRNCTQQFFNLKNVTSSNDLTNKQVYTSKIQKQERTIKKDFKHKQKLVSNNFPSILSDRKYINEISQIELNKEQISSGKKINYQDKYNNQKNKLQQRKNENYNNIENELQLNQPSSYFSPDNQHQLRITKKEQEINDLYLINQQGPTDKINNNDYMINKKEELNQIKTPKSKNLLNKSAKKFHKDEQEINSDVNQNSQYMIRTVSSQKLPCEFSTTKQIKNQDQKEISTNNGFCIFEEQQTNNREMINKNQNKINKVNVQSAKKISQFNINGSLKKQISPLKMMESNSKAISKGEYCQDQINMTAQKYKDAQMGICNNQYACINKIQSSYCLSDKKDSFRQTSTYQTVFQNENQYQTKQSNKKQYGNKLTSNEQISPNSQQKAQIKAKLNYNNQTGQNKQENNDSQYFNHQSLNQNDKNNFTVALTNISFLKSKRVSQNDILYTKRSINQSSTEIKFKQLNSQNEQFENNSENKLSLNQQQKESVEIISSYNLNKYINQSQNMNSLNNTKDLYNVQGRKSVTALKQNESIQNQSKSNVNNNIDEKQNQIFDCYLSSCSTNRLQFQCNQNKKTNAGHLLNNKLNSSVIQANEMQSKAKDEECKQNQLKLLQGLNDGMRKSRSKMGKPAPVLQNVSQQNVNHLTSYNSLFSNTRRSVQNSSKINIQSQVKIGGKNGYANNRNKNNQSKLRKELNQSVQEKIKRPNEINQEIASYLQNQQKQIEKNDNVEFLQKSDKSTNSDEIIKQSQEDTSINNIFSVSNYDNYDKQVNNLKQKQINENKLQQNKMDNKGKEDILKEVINPFSQKNKNGHVTKRPAFIKEEPNKPISNKHSHFIQLQQDQEKGIKKNINQIIKNHVQLQIEEKQLGLQSYKQEDINDDDIQEDSINPYQVNSMILAKQKSQIIKVQNSVALNQSVTKTTNTILKDENKYAKITGVLKQKGDQDCHHNQSVISQDTYNKEDHRLKRVNAPQIITNGQTGLESERNKNPIGSYLSSKNKNLSAVRSQNNQFIENTNLRQSSERYKNQHLSSLTNKITNQYNSKQAMEINQFNPQKTQKVGQNQNMKTQESIYLNPQRQGLQPKVQIKEKKQSFLSILQPQEKEKFGDRCPKGFTKLGLLGKGGIALVWLGEINDIEKYGYNQKMLGQKVALKQFPKTKGQCPIDNSAKTEIETGNILFPLRLKDDCDGSKDQDYERVSALDDQQNPGFNSIAKMIDQIEDSKDVWLVYEVGDQCLGKHLSEVKGEFYKGERIYKVQHQLFYQILAKDWKILRTFIIKMCEIFDILSKFGIVHSDIKPDNILIQINDNLTDIQQLKLIDFGSAFQFHNVTQITGTTPEYLAPEILDYLEQRNKFQKSELSTAINLSHRCQPWSFDVWSLGIILLEIASGCPVWMSLKCRVQTVDGKSIIGQGLLGVQGREQKRIIQKQQQIFKNIQQTFKKFECYDLDKDPRFMDLLNRMLCFDSNKRISPQEIIQHPFCTNK